MQVIIDTYTHSFVGDDRVIAVVAASITFKNTAEQAIRIADTEGNIQIFSPKIKGTKYDDILEGNIAYGVINGLAGNDTIKNNY